MTRELTNSMRNKFASCHRAFKFCYEDLKRPINTSDALNFGTAMHSMLEAYWQGKKPFVPNMEDGYTTNTLLALFEGYQKKWQESDRMTYETIGTEIRFDAPLMNPETGGTSKTFHLAGKIDALAKEKTTGKVVIVEHKTTGQDIGPGSDYWRKLPIDGQVSGYYCGAQALDHEASTCLYDVIRKPTIKPYKATPEEKRKYNKDGSLSKACRENDETPDEWYERLSADIASRPDYYYARIEISRSDNDLLEYLFDMWAVSREIADAQRMNRWSRNPQACSVFGTCEYFGVCTGEQDIDDVTLFRTAERANEEL
jgi:hypothetical protein